MGLIFSLSGCKAVGKSTLINGICQHMPKIIIREGFRYFETGYDMTIEEEYYEHEKLYFNREIEEYHQFKNQDAPALLVRGPEDMEFYGLHYLKLNNYNWDIETALKKELNELRACRSDHLLYLDASIDTIIRRKGGHVTKVRANMESWLRDWQPNLEPFIKSLPATTILNTDNMTAEMVLKWSLNWIAENISQAKQH